MTACGTTASRRDIAAERSHRRPGSRPRSWWRLLPLGGAALLVAVTVGFGWRYWTIGRLEKTTHEAYPAADSPLIAPLTSESLSETDDSHFNLGVDEARAEVAASQAEIADVEASLIRQQAVIEQARAMVAACAAAVAIDAAAVTFAHREHDRYATLAKSGDGSAQNAVAKLETMVATAVLEAQHAQVYAGLVHDRAIENQAELNLEHSARPMSGAPAGR